MPQLATIGTDAVALVPSADCRDTRTMGPLTNTQGHRVGDARGVHYEFKVSKFLVFLAVYVYLTGYSISSVGSGPSDPVRGIE